MLDAAGVEHEVVEPELDEKETKAQLTDPVEIATELAKAKALSVTSQATGDWVIGSDSVVCVAGRLFDKPRGREEAAEHLRFFSGKRMELTSAVALARDGHVEWSHAETATLDVRPLSDRFILSYLDTEWPEVAYCVGVFRMEARGVQLFERIEGSHFTILGMPLIALLAALRDRGLIAS